MGNLVHQTMHTINNFNTSCTSVPVYVQYYIALQQYNSLHYIPVQYSRQIHYDIPSLPVYAKGDIKQMYLICFI